MNDTMITVGLLLLLILAAVLWGAIWLAVIRQEVIPHYDTKGD